MPFLSCAIAEVKDILQVISRDHDNCHSEPAISILSRKLYNKSPNNDR